MFYFLPQQLQQYKTKSKTFSSRQWIQLKCSHRNIYNKQLQASEIHQIHIADQNHEENLKKEFQQLQKSKYVKELNNENAKNQTELETEDEI